MRQSEHRAVGAGFERLQHRHRWLLLLVALALAAGAAFATYQTVEAADEVACNGDTAAEMAGFDCIELVNKGNPTQTLGELLFQRVGDELTLETNLFASVVDPLPQTEVKLCLDDDDDPWNEGSGQAGSCTGGNADETIAPDDAFSCEAAEEAAGLYEFLMEPLAEDGGAGSGVYVIDDVDECAFFVFHFNQDEFSIEGHFEAPPVGSIIIDKEDDIGGAVGGAGFTFTPDPFDGVGVLEIFDGGAEDQADADDGRLCIDSVRFADYDIEETTVPPGYLGDTRTLEVLIDSTSTCADRLGGSPVPDATFVNTRVGSILILKLDDSGDLLPGAGFTFDPNPFTGGAAVEILDGDVEDQAVGNDGVLCIDDVLFATYGITESTVPDGHLGDVSIGDVTVSDHDTCSDRLPPAYDEPGDFVGDFLPDVTVINTLVGGPGGTEGCTPGFWKTHAEDWDNGLAPNYQPGDNFHMVFGVEPADTGLHPNLTLEQALNLRGGNIKALTRHAVAALLNADSTVDYKYTAAQVIQIYQEAIDTAMADEIESAKNDLETENERDCPFGNGGPRGGGAGPVANANGFWKARLLAGSGILGP